MVDDNEMAYWCELEGMWAVWVLIIALSLCLYQALQTYHKKFFLCVLVVINLLKE